MIEFVSLDSVLPSGEKLVIADISTVLHNQHTEYHLTPVFTGTDVNGRPEFAADQDLRLYADGGTDVTVIGVTDTPAPNGFTGVIAGQVSGYLIDCLVAPCN